MHNLNFYPNLGSYLPVLQNNLLNSLTLTQKRILAVVAIAFSLLAICFGIHFCFCREKKVKPLTDESDMKKEIILDKALKTEKPFGPDMIEKRVPGKKKTVPLPNNLGEVYNDFRRNKLIIMQFLENSSDLKTQLFEILKESQLKQHKQQDGKHNCSCGFTNLTTEELYYVAVNLLKYENTPALSKICGEIITKVKNP